MGERGGRRSQQLPSTSQLSPPAITGTGWLRSHPWCQELEHGLGRVGAGRAERAVDDECRHRADTELGRGALVVADLVGEPVAREHRAGLVVIEPDLGGQADERVVVGHELALGEVGAEQALFHRVLEPVLAGEMDDAMGIKGGAAAGHVEAEVKALAGRRVGHLTLHLAGVLDGHAVLLRESLGTIALALRRGGGVELEAPPRHAHVVAMLELARARPRTGAYRCSTKDRRCRTRFRFPSVPG